MACNCSVGGFILIISIRRRKDAGHHSQGTESCGDHIAHNIAVIVLECPYKATFTSYDSCYSIVDESVEVCNSLLFELLFILFFIYLLECKLESLIILLADGIFCTEPKILRSGKSIVKAGAGERRD